MWNVIISIFLLLQFLNWRCWGDEVATLNAEVPSPTWPAFANESHIVILLAKFLWRRRCCAEGVLWLSDSHCARCTVSKVPPPHSNTLVCNAFCASESLHWTNHIRTPRCHRYTGKGFHKVKPFDSYGITISCWTIWKMFTTDPFNIHSLKAPHTDK